jgi:hypothetical protein
MRNGAEIGASNISLRKYADFWRSVSPQNRLLLFHALDDPAENRPVPQLFARHISSSMRI